MKNLRQDQQDDLPLSLDPGPPRLSLPNQGARAALSRGRQTGVGCITLVAVFFVAVLSFGLAYQTRPTYKIDLGEKLDRPFVVGFEEREIAKQPDEKGQLHEISFRWSHATGYLNLPGLGSQPLSVTLRYTPSSNPKSDLVVFVNNKNQAVLSPPINQDGWLVQSFGVPSGWFPDGHLHLKFQTTTFQPKGDPRELGLAFDWVVVRPDEAAGGGFIRPADSVFLTLIFTAVLAVLIFLSIGVPVAWALGAVGVLIAGFTYWLINDRLSLTSLLEQDFIRVLFFLWVSAYLIARYLPRLFRTMGLAAGRLEGGWLAGLFLLQFVVLYFVQLHPLFKSSDIGLHIHKFEAVQGGQLVFSEDLPGNLPAPYPPAFYVLLQPFTLLSGSNEAQLGSLITLVNSILAASGVFLVYYLATLLRGPIVHQVEYQDSYIRLKSSQLGANGPDWGALLAAAFYTLNRFQFFIFSQGNETNLFGAWIFLLFLAVLAGTLNYLRHPRPHIVPVSNVLPPPTPARASSTFGRWQRQVSYWSRQILWPRLDRGVRALLPVGLLWVVFLSHYGTFLFTNVFMVIYLLIMLGLGGKAGRREALYLGVCWLVALILAVALYYYNFLDVITSQLGGSKSGIPRPSLDLGASLKAFYVSSRDNFGLIVLMAALGGLALIIVRRFRQPGWWQVEPVSGALIALTLSSLAFALAEAIQRESRYQLYFVTALVIVAGYWLGQVWRRGWAGRVLVISLFLFQFLTALLFWLDRVTYYL